MQFKVFNLWLLIRWTKFEVVCSSYFVKKEQDYKCLRIKLGLD